jgi:hypothetical protein
MQQIFQKLRLALASTPQIVLVSLITGGVMPATGQAGTGETVIQKATEQFESTPLRTISLAKGHMDVFRGRRKRYGLGRTATHC